MMAWKKKAGREVVAHSDMLLANTGMVGTDPYKLYGISKYTQQENIARRWVGYARGYSPVPSWLPDKATVAAATLEFSMHRTKLYLLIYGDGTRVDIREHHPRPDDWFCRPYTGYHGPPRCE